MDTTELLLIVLTLLIAWSVVKFLSTPKNLPPGPWGLPFIGYVPFLGKKPQVVIANLRPKYGDVIRLNLGVMHLIFLTSFNAVKDAFVKQSDAFSDRFVPILPPVIRAAPGVASSSGEIWSEFRRFTLSTLRDLGIGKSSLEPQILSEIQCFIQEVKSFNGQPASLNEALRLSVINVICVITAGKRLDYDDPIFNKLFRVLEEYLSLFQLGLPFFLPFALQKPWVMRLLGTKSPLETTYQLQALLAEVIDKFEKEYEQGSVDNFINAWFTESKKVGAKVHYFNNTQLKAVLMDLFIAGGDTSATTLSWMVLYMMKYPGVQSKVQKEIDEVIGKERTPSMADLKLMPYTEATLMEVNRIASIVPFGIFHGTTKDTSLHGFFIPKNSGIMPNLWAIHHDPDIFPDPFDFNPQRFLTDDLQVKRMEELIPFSIGKRQCPGESLAKMELFLFFTSMLQHFTFQKVDGVEVDLDFSPGLLSAPKPQLTRAVIR